MSIKKPSAQTLTRNVNELSAQKEHRKSLQVIAHGKDGDFWKALKVNMEHLIKGAERRVAAILVDDSIEPTSELANAKYWAGAKSTLEQLIGMVECNDDFVAATDARIKALEDAIQEIRQQEEAQVP